MRRGDIVTVAVSGDYGKPRPAVIVQSDRLAETDSVLVCPFTTTLREAPFHRLRIEPSSETGLREPSDVMIDKVISVRRARVGATIGRLSDEAIAMLDGRLAVVIGLAD